MMILTIELVVGTGWCTGVGNSISYLSGITTSAIGAGSSSGVVGIITGINLDTFRCSRDVRDILKAVCYDITRGGSTKVVAAGKTYFDETLDLKLVFLPSLLLLLITPQLMR